jgi:hypothetical protein
VYFNCTPTSLAWKCNAPKNYTFLAHYIQNTLPYSTAHSQTIIFYGKVKLSLSMPRKYVGGWKCNSTHSSLRHSMEVSPGRLIPRTYTPVSTGYETGWDAEPVWTSGELKYLICLPGVEPRFLGRPVHILVSTPNTLSGFFLGGIKYWLNWPTNFVYGM